MCQVNFISYNQFIIIYTQFIIIFFYLYDSEHKTLFASTFTVQFVKNKLFLIFSINIYTRLKSIDVNNANKNTFFFS